MDSLAPPASSDAEITNGAANAEGANATAAAPNAQAERFARAIAINLWSAALIRG
jgi:hypothetical protein